MVSVGIASVSMNREDNIVQSLPSWLDSGAECIHILDWNSEFDLENIIKKKFGNLDNVKFFRVDNKKPWVLTHAFNIVLSSLKTDFIAKFDSDHVCNPSIFKELKLEIGSFYRFNFLDNMKGTNGAFISSRDILEKVNFFDERIVTYGWDESDLFERVQEHARKIYFLDRNYISHLPHTKNRRIESQNISIEKKISKFLNVDESEFSTKCNFFKGSLSNKWDINSKSGFVICNDNFEEKELNTFNQKEFFDRSISDLAFIMSIQFFQNNYFNAKTSHISPKKILDSEVSNYILDYLRFSVSNQWDLIEIFKYIAKEKSSFIPKKELKNLMKKLFMKSADDQLIRKNREEYLNILQNYIDSNIL